MILVVCALPEELRDYRPSSLERVLAAGVGPVESAIATARALATDTYLAVVSAGIGGAYRGSGTVGDAFVVGFETLADFGLESGEPLTLPGGAMLMDTVSANGEVLERCEAAGMRVTSGLTVAQITTTDATAQRLSARYRAGVESMEGFSVLRAAADAGIPAVEVRGISNLVGDRARGEWDFAAGARATAATLKQVLTILKESC